MQTDNRRIERIGECFAVLGLLSGMALLVGTLVSDRSSPQRCRPGGLRGWARADSRGKMRPPVAAKSSRRGSNRLFVFRKGERAVERLRPGAILAAGDLIQIAYTAGSATHGVILSVDGRGVVTLHHPARLHETTALEPFGRQLLPYSFELDGAPICERFFFVTGDQPIDVAAVTAAGRATAMGALTATRCLHPRLPSGLRLSDELLLKKTAPR